MAVDNPPYLCGQPQSRLWITWIFIVDNSAKVVEMCGKCQKSIRKSATDMPQRLDFFVLSHLFFLYIKSMINNLIYELRNMIVDEHKQDTTLVRFCQRGDVHSFCIPKQLGHHLL